MALILLPDFTVELDGELESRGYYDLTLQVLKEHGIGNGEGGPSTSSGTTTGVPEGDWSSAAFLLCLGALVPDGQIILHGLNKNSLQKDKIIISILEQLGFAFTWNGSSVELTARPDVNKTRELELNLDAADYPDIVPYIAIVAAAYTKTTSIKNIERLHFKECDRVEATINVLKATGVSAYEKEGTLYITGGHNVAGELSISTYNDHRMAMTACLVAAWTGLSVLIDNKECVNKSFPGLWSII
jgi:3-phosphoshikimate 1-carboxyvinyltransferase